MSVREQVRESVREPGPVLVAALAAVRVSALVPVSVQSSVYLSVYCGQSVCPLWKITHGTFQERTLRSHGATPGLGPGAAKII